MSSIKAKVKEHFNTANEKYNVWVTMLYGSQNYGLATEESDVDVKTMIFPSFKDVVLGKSMVSCDLSHPYDDSLNNVKDFRGMFHNYLKGNINFLETLYTPWYIVNPMNEEYKKYFDDLRSHRELIANSQPRKLVHMAAGMAKQKFVAMEKPFESKKEILAKYGYDPKQLHHLVRLKFFIENFIFTGSFDKSLIPNEENRKMLLDLKVHPVPLEEAREWREWAMDRIDNEFVLIADKNLPLDNKRNEAEEYLEELTLSLFEYNIYKS